ncbi:MAG TPA: hypothetical protein VGD11_07595, partial [Mycobacteriales bacterium]
MTAEGSTTDGSTIPESNGENEGTPVTATPATIATPAAPAADVPAPADAPAPTETPAPTEAHATPEAPTPTEAHAPVEAPTPTEAHAPVEAHATPHPAAPHPARPQTDGAAYGRIDADGTVYVRTATGERAVGSWQAGSPEEGLAHFARRYDDLATEVELLEARLDSGAADAQHTLAGVHRLQASLATAAVVGDIDALALRLDALADKVSA